MASVRKLRKKNGEVFQLARHMERSRRDGRAGSPRML